LGADAIGHRHLITRVQWIAETACAAAGGAGVVLAAVRRREMVSLEVPSSAAMNEVSQVHSHEFGRIERKGRHGRRRWQEHLSIGWRGLSARNGLTEQNPAGLGINIDLTSIFDAQSRNAHLVGG